jgi:hypothetical protein
MKTFGDHELLSPRRLAELVARFSARRASIIDRAAVMSQMTSLYEKLQKEKTERESHHSSSSSSSSHRSKDM